MFHHTNTLNVGFAVSRQIQNSLILVIIETNPFIMAIVGVCLLLKGLIFGEHDQKPPLSEIMISMTKL